MHEAKSSEFYTKSKGNAGLDGVQFQVGLSTIILLNALQNFTGWKISTENTAAGKFDDIVIELSDGSAVLVQAKHKDSRKINRDQLLSDNTKNADFSLPKYFLSYQEIKSKFNVKNIIIITNSDLDKKKLKDILTSQVASSDSILFYENVKKCSFITFYEKILPELKEKTKSYYDKNVKGKDVDRDMISDENLKEFLEKLQLFTGYPSRKQLSKVVDQLLSRLSVSELWNGTSFQEIYGKVEDWFKQERGEYLDECIAKYMICEIRTERYCKKLRNYNVSFQCEDFNFPNGKRIFHVNTEGGCTLQALKTYRALQEKKTLFMHSDDGLEVQNQVVEAFGFPKHEYLVFIFSNQRLISEIIIKLKDILSKCTYKKIVLIGGKKIVGQFDPTDDLLELNGSITFESLTREYREMLVKKRIITFQGEDVLLEEVIPVLKDEDYDKAANSEVLENLVKGDKITVGSRCLVLAEDIAKYYITRIFEREIDDDDLISGGRRKEIFAEKDIFEVKQKAVLISDSAGMGKTTVLANLALDIKKKYPNLWVINVELNDYGKILSKSLKMKKNTITLTELLNSNVATKFINKLETFVFYQREKIVLILDGFDEISPDYTILVLNLLKQCYTASNFAKIIITTRPHMSLELQKLLRVEPFTLQPFTREDQIAFLTDYWGSKLEVEEEDKCRCEKFAVALINKMSSWINAKNSFAAIPLQVRMLAEIFEESSEWEGCKEFIEGEEEEPLLPERMNITELYSMFVDTKLDVFLGKANPTGTTGGNLLKNLIKTKHLTNHKCIALKVVLSDKVVQDERILDLFSSLQYEVDAETETELLKIGIIQKTQAELEFVHRTFAEYFAAEAILDISELRSKSFSQDLNFQIFFIDKLLCNPKYTVIRAFLECSLEGVVDSLPSNIFDNYRRSAMSDPESKKHRSELIHLLAAEGCLSILRLILKCMSHDFEPTSGMADDDDVHNTLDLLKRLLESDGFNIKDEKANTPLHHASKGGYLNVVRYIVEPDSRSDLGELEMCLLKHSIDVDQANIQGCTSLHLAVSEGHLDVVRYLVEEHDASVHLGDNKKFTPLHSASRHGHLDILKFLVEQGANVNAEDENGCAALFSACYYGHLKVITFLVEKGANVDTVDAKGFTPLYTASGMNHLEVVSFLLEKGAKIDATADKDGYTALSLASYSGHLNVVKFLIQHNANVNAVRENGPSPLNRASQNGQLDVVKYLLQKDANVNTVNSYGYTPVSSASYSGHSDVVKFLVHHGANVSAVEGIISPLPSACQHGHLEVVKFLTEEGGADINAVDEYGVTPIYLASYYGHMGVVRCLVEKGANVNLKVGYSPLYSASQEGHLDIIKFLVEHGADINALPERGCFPLHMASQNGRLEIVKYFLEKGADTNAICECGSTALHRAAEEGLSDVVEVLVQDPCLNVNVVDTEGFTPLHLACREGHLDVVVILVAHGVDTDVRADNGLTALEEATEKRHTAVIEFLCENVNRVVQQTLNHDNI